ncbi:MAG: hypothetical protein J0J10_26885, partial [Bosea sp.]|uniref:hypothetical protein n=1 Tax=Bosea sp. (in: a-proteobacteria) TaxID=1871050 RepID=UPI001ACB140F
SRPRGLHPRHGRAGGCATRSCYAARAGVEANRPLTFNPDLSAGADQSLHHLALTPEFVGYQKNRLFSTHSDPQWRFESSPGHHSFSSSKRKSSASKRTDRHRISLAVVLIGSSDDTARHYQDGFLFFAYEASTGLCPNGKGIGPVARDRWTSIRRQPPLGRLLAQDQRGEVRQEAVQARAKHSRTCFESLSQPPLGRADVRALACEICKQAVHEIDHDDAVADEAEAYRDAFAEATERPLRSSRP